MIAIIVGNCAGCPFVVATENQTEPWFCDAMQDSDDFRQLPEQRVPGPGFDRCRLGDQPHRLPFADLWDAINGTRAAWASNPWVWVITFTRVR